MEKDISKNEQIWTVVFVVIPAIILPKTSSIIAPNASPILMSAILGGLGASIGYMTYNFVKNKNTTSKVIALVSLITLLAIVIIGLAEFL